MKIPDRKTLSHTIYRLTGEPTIVFVTICTRDRYPWLATPENHILLNEVWTESNAWLVGRYVILPDHIHLFCAPGAIDLPLDNWVRYWKSQFTRRNKVASCQWQSGFWDTRLHRTEDYDAKWEYARNNPVRHGLVVSADMWPYQGELNNLEW